MVETIVLAEFVVLAAFVALVGLVAPAFEFQAFILPSLLMAKE